MNRRLFAFALAASLLLPGPARAAATDWFASLYSNEGVELRVEERVFALYALFNAMGYQEAPIVRHDPIPFFAWDPVRAALREKVTIAPEFRRKVEAFFAAHPLPASEYLKFVLSTEGAPTFKPTRDAPAALKGFDALLSEFYTTHKLGEMFQQVQEPYRAVLKLYQPTIDAPMSALKKLLRVKDDDAQRMVLVANLLDGQGLGQATQVGDEVYVGIGPSATPDLLTAIREAAKARLAPIVMAKKMAGLTDQAAAAGYTNPQLFALEAFARAFAVHLLGGQEAMLVSQSQRGFAAVPAIVDHLRAYDKGSKSFDAFMADALVALAITPNGAKTR